MTTVRRLELLAGAVDPSSLALTDERLEAGVLLGRTRDAARHDAGRPL